MMISYLFKLSFENSQNIHGVERTLIQSFSIVSKLVESSGSFFRRNESVNSILKVLIVS